MARRRKRSHYKTGVHISSKCTSGKIKYRSGWEFQVCLWLDSDPLVASYGYECLKIPYVANYKTGKVRIYFPDFLITYTNGDRKLVEVKRMDKIGTASVIKKSAAARTWCDGNNVVFEIWSNTMIEGIRKINESKGLK